VPFTSHFLDYGWIANENGSEMNSVGHSLLISITDFTRNKNYAEHLTAMWQHGFYTRDSDNYTRK